TNTSRAEWNNDPDRAVWKILSRGRAQPEAQQEARHDEASETPKALVNEVALHDLSPVGSIS
ncbi:MAG: hypothetical protein ACKODQ_10450, partial [Betaproteobacteria bacterium]